MPPRSSLPWPIRDFHRLSAPLLVLFCAALLALNVWRLEAWGWAGFEVYFTHAIMQTTLFDFAWVLAILAVFIDADARRHQLRWWWIVPTFPFMPTIGLLLYFFYRQRTLQKREQEVPPLGEAPVAK